MDEESIDYGRIAEDLLAGADLLEKHPHLWGKGDYVTYSDDDLDCEHPHFCAIGVSILRDDAVVAEQEHRDRIDLNDLVYSRIGNAWGFEDCEVEDVLALKALVTLNDQGTSTLAEVIKAMRDTAHGFRGELNGAA